jgi:hypothetical protein
MTKTEHKNLSSPDETRSFEHGKVEIINIGQGTVGRLTLEPGWRWSQHVKPIAGTEWCEAPHFQCQVSGRLHVQMQDGAEFELGPGDVSCLPKATMPGSSETSRSYWWIGTAQATTRRVRRGNPAGNPINAENLRKAKYHPRNRTCEKPESHPCSIKTPFCGGLPGPGCDWNFSRNLFRGW